jgi:hypothetical protein
MRQRKTIWADYYPETGTKTAARIGWRIVARGEHYDVNKTFGSPAG